MAFLLAITPILLILVLMVGLRWSAARAGGAGYLCALIIGVVFFGLNPILLAYAHAKALLLAIDVLMIIWAAFLLYRVVDEAGAIRTIGEALPHLTTDRGMQALIIGWVFASFLQGVGGFGVPVAVIAPILIGLGFAPLDAVVIPSIGHGWAITFGSLGSSFQALMTTTGLPDKVLSPFSAQFLGAAGVVSGLMVAHVAGSWEAIRRLWLPTILFGGVMAVVQYVTAVLGFWNIAAFSGSIAGLVICFPIARRYRGEQNNNGILNVKALLVAISGFALLVVVILSVQLIPALQSFLSSVVIQLKFPQISTSVGLLSNAPFVTPAGFGRKISLFSHTGSVLVYAATLAYMVYWRAGMYRPGAIRRIVGGTLRKVLSSSVSIVSMVTMASIMEHSGMTHILARDLAEGMGSLFPVAASWIGALGAFMTGSNTNSNMVFGALQMQTANLLGYPLAIILAAQTAGAALASVMAPTKVVVGASTAGMAGKEGLVMRKLFIYAGLLVLFISLLTSISIWIM